MSTDRSSVKSRRCRSSRTAAASVSSSAEPQSVASAAHKDNVKQGASERDEGTVDTSVAVASGGDEIFETARAAAKNEAARLLRSAYEPTPPHKVGVSKTMTKATSRVRPGKSYAKSPSTPALVVKEEWTTVAAPTSTSRFREATTRSKLLDGGSLEVNASDIKTTRTPKTADKAVQTGLGTAADVSTAQTAAAAAHAAVALDEEASVSVETAAYRSLSQRAPSLSAATEVAQQLLPTASLRRCRSGALRVLPWLARVNSSSLAASKEELDRLYKENANLMRRLADARADSPVVFKNTAPPAAAATTPKEYEMYVSNTSRKKKRSISIQINMPKFKSKKKNRMTTEATILMLIRKLRRILKANKLQPLSRNS